MYPTNGKYNHKLSNPSPNRDQIANPTKNKVMRVRLLGTDGTRRPVGASASASASTLFNSNTTSLRKSMLDERTCPHVYADLSTEIGEASIFEYLQPKGVIVLGVGPSTMTISSQLGPATIKSASEEGIEPFRRCIMSGFSKLLVR
jgi:hypothetical protein